MISSLLKSALSVVATPVAIVADVAMLPASSMEGKDPFARTAAVLDNAGKQFMKAVGDDESEGCK